MTEPEPGPTEWGAPAAGVGPWAGALPDDPRYDPNLLRDGDTRNVVDAYRYWTREAIIADIDRRRHPLHVAIENFGHDANIGSVVRTANAFAVDTVHIVGRRRWNRRGAMVTDRYQRLCHHDSTAELLDFAAGAGLTVVAVDNVPGAARLEETSLPRECLLVFGQEGPGHHRRHPCGCDDHGVDRPVRLDAQHQCRRRGGHRDARLDSAARRPEARLVRFECALMVSSVRVGRGFGDSSVDARSNPSRHSAGGEGPARRRGKHTRRASPGHDCGLGGLILNETSSLMR